MKKILSVALTVLLLIGIMPFSGAAEDVASGTCGDNLTWSYNSGTLTISGIGDMTDYISYAAAPWRSLRSSITNVVIEDGVTSIGDYAFAYCEELTDITMPESVASIGRYAFEACGGLTSITIGDGVTNISRFPFSGCDGLTEISVANDFAGVLNDGFKVIRRRESIEYPSFENSAAVFFEKTDFEYTSSGDYSWQNEITSHDPVTLISSGGELYALCGLFADTVTLLTKSDGSLFTLSEPGFSCGAGVIGDDDMLYLLWAQDASDDVFDKAPETCSVKVIKYDLSGNKTGELGFPLSATYSTEPYHSGNAALVYNGGKLCVLWNTLWNGQYTNDGYHHQGCEFAVLNTGDMTCDTHQKNIGSHSFGVSAVKSGRGFAFTQLEDASHRGVSFCEYNIADNVFAANRLCVFSSPGQYGTNENKLDGNETYLRYNGVAESKTTFAFCVFGTDVYTSDVFFFNSLHNTALYDVYVRILDKSLIRNTNCAGEERIDAATGNTADYNVVKLTSLDNLYNVTNLKIVTLESGAYCVLWNQDKNGYYYDEPGLYYAVLDEQGNILRPATAVMVTRMSDCNTPPAVCENKLYWAVNNDGGVEWITLDLTPAVCENHSWKPGPVIKSATCTEDGEAVYYCPACGAVKTEITEHGHVPGNTVIENEIAAASDSGGSYDEVVYCSVCGTELGREKVITEKTALAGDVNHDGKVKASDARLTLRYAAGLEAAENLDTALADVNADGKVKANDARLILRAAAGLENL